MIDPVEFPLIAKRIGGATRWSTDISDGLNGDEVRNANWQDSLRRFNASFGVKTLADQAVLENWHLVCLGPAIGFLLRDWKDYKATHQATSLGHNATRQGVMAAVDGSNTIFQLQHLYSNGYRNHRRKITRPQSGTITLYDNPGHVLIGSGYTIDYTTGLVTFGAAQTNPPFWNGQFYVPARFQDDEVQWDVMMLRLSNGGGHGELPECVMVEVRE